MDLIEIVYHRIICHLVGYPDLDTKIPNFNAIFGVQDIGDKLPIIQLKLFIINFKTTSFGGGYVYMAMPEIIKSLCELFQKLCYFCLNN